MPRFELGISCVWSRRH